MKRVAWLVGCACACVVLMGAGAAAHPDFTGEWTLDVAHSQFGGASHAAKARVDRIVHKDPHVGGGKLERFRFVGDSAVSFSTSTCDED